MIIKKFVNLKLILSILTLSIFNYTFVREDKKESNAGQIAAAAIGGAFAGYGIYQLFSSFCCSNDSLIDDACKELMLAKQFSEQLTVLESNFEGLSNLDKKQLILSIDENLAKDIVETSPKKLINYNYYSTLKSNIKNLKYYQTKLPKRIRKLEKDRNRTKNLPKINDMNELSNRIDILLTKLESLNTYVNTHEKYYKLDETIEYLSKCFNNEFKILKAKKIFVQEIKKCACLKNKGYMYPLLEYVRKIRNEIKNLDNYLYKAKQYADLVQDGKSIKTNLMRLENIICSDRQYSAEREDERLQGVISGGMFCLGAATGLATSLFTKKEEIVEDDEIIEEEIIGEEVYIRPNSYEIID